MPLQDTDPTPSFGGFGLTLTLAVLWFVQHSLGYGIADARWIETIHIPLALVIFGLALYLTDRAYRALKGHPG